VALTTLDLSFTLVINWLATKSVTGIPVINSQPTSGTQNKIRGVSTTAAAAAGGADELVAGVATITASSSTTLDLTSIANVAGDTTAFARIKFVAFRLLGASDTAFDGTTVGTAATPVTIGNAASNATQMFLGGDTETIILTNGDWVAYATGGAAGKVIDSTNKNVKIANGDAAVSAKVLYVFGGGTV